MNNPWLGLVVIGAMVIAALVALPMLPDQIPIHWNAAGEPDDWASKWPAALLAPGVALAMWALFWLLPKIDPRGAHYRRFWKTYWLLANVVILFMALLHGVTLGAALGWAVEVDRVLVVAVGVLFLVLGYYLPRVPSNWWIGIRTPWTLESESVWRRTHRLAGRTFPIGGLVTIAGVFLPPGYRPFAAMAGVTIAGSIPVVYSYIAWRRERRGSQP